MSEPRETLAESTSAEAVNATAVAQEAIEKARAAQMTAIVESAIAKFFDRGVQEKKFIDIGRIPFICDDIGGIHESLKEIKEKAVTKEDFNLVKNIVFGFIALIVIAFMGALFALVFK
jgi:hypothetical protein